MSFAFAAGSGIATTPSGIKIICISAGLAMLNLSDCHRQRRLHQDPKTFPALSPPSEPRPTVPPRPAWLGHWGKESFSRHLGSATKFSTQLSPSKPGQKKEVNAPGISRSRRRGRFEDPTSSTTSPVWAGRFLEPTHQDCLAQSLLSSESKSES